MFPGGDRLPSHFDLESGDAALNPPTRKQVKELIVLDASARIQDSYDSWMQAQECRILTIPGSKRKNAGFLRMHPGTIPGSKRMHPIFIPSDLDMEITRKYEILAVDPKSVCKRGDGIPLHLDIQPGVKHSLDLVES